MIIIMWACVCIILHNLIIRIEGGNFDNVLRASLFRRGLHDVDAGGDSSSEDDPGDDLEQAQCHLETPEQHFRLRLMDKLFDSPSCNAIHRPV